MNISRAWAMPSADTFTIPPLKALARKYLRDSKRSLDPFARNCRLASVTNDLSLDTAAEHHMDAEAFAGALDPDSFDLILFDPPYSYRQCVEIYQGIGREWTQRDHQQVQRWSQLKDSLSRTLQFGGVAISCGWNTSGFGKRRGFAPLEYLIINHGSAHNDTMVTVERKVQAALMLEQPEKAKAA